MEEFLKRTAARCYIKEHQGHKAEYKETPCSDADIKRFMKETLRGKADKDYVDYIVRGRSPFGHEYWTQRRGEDTLVFGVSFVNMDTAHFYFAKYKVIFRPK